MHTGEINYTVEIVDNSGEKKMLLSSFIQSCQNNIGHIDKK